MPEDGSSPGAAFAPTSSRSSSSQTPESAGQDGRPQTPQHRRGHSEPHNAFSPKSPPTLPSPMTMNLYRLGIGSSPLSPLRRQFSSSFSHNNNPATLAKDRSADADDELSEEESETGDTSCDGDHDDDLTQDSKDVLVDRLNDILQRLSTGGGLGGANISILHGQVDEMEKVLASDHHKPSRPKTPRQRPSLLQLASPLPIVRSSSGTKISDDAQHPGYWGFTSTPPSRQPVPPFSEGSSPVITATAVDQLFISTTPPRFHGEDEESEMPSEVADSLVQEAEKLCKELNAVLKNLQDRREESDARPLAPFLPPLFPTCPANMLHSISTRCSLKEQKLQLNESWS